MQPFFWLLALITITVLIYLPGINGPFLFDDAQNIVSPIQAWLDGRTGWQDIVFGNRSGLFGRPLPMATFLANTALSGLAAMPFKATNLAIHIICGILIYKLIFALLKRDPLLGSRAEIYALLVCALWLLHPMQVSTVLYIVQRMAQLSTLFTLIALLSYVRARLYLETGRNKIAWIYLFLLLPFAGLAAILSKENGALIPLFCAIIELGYFSSGIKATRPVPINLFFCFSLLLPGLILLIWISLHPQRLTDVYAGRLFTLGERLLSEPRVIMDYMGALLLPRGPSLGLYTDDFTASHGLLDPASTLFALVGLILLILAACWSRKHIPGFFTGIAFYLAGHVMESTIFPLELYFEHRNYLPSIGFFLAVASLTAWLANCLLSRSVKNRDRIRGWLIFGTAGVLITLGLATMARAQTWNSAWTVAIQGVQQHPDSMRAQLDYVNMLESLGRHEETQQVFDHLATLANPAARHIAAIDTVSLKCMSYGATTPDAIAHIAAFAGAKLQLSEMLAFEYLGRYIEKHDCKGLGKDQLAALIAHIVDAAPQPAGLNQLWRSRFIAAQLYLAAGMLPNAQEQDALAWITGAADPAIGIHLANIYYLEGDKTSARLVLADAIKQIKPWDQRNLRLVRELTQQFENGQPAAATSAAAMH